MNKNSRTTEQEFERAVHDALHLELRGIKPDPALLSRIVEQAGRQNLLQIGNPTSERRGIIARAANFFRSIMNRRFVISVAALALIIVFVGVRSMRKPLVTVPQQQAVGQIAPSNQQQVTGNVAVPQQTINQQLPNVTGNPDDIQNDLSSESAQIQSLSDESAVLSQSLPDDSKEINELHDEADASHIEE